VSKKVRLTTAQALVRFLANQYGLQESASYPLFRGIFAIFGHGNVTGLGEALQHSDQTLPVFRAHNEQSMAHAAIAFAKASKRQQMMACTTSVGPGATNMVTAAALAHVNRLPVLLLPGDTFANRLPDPVLQQVEDFSDPTVTANDCFRPVSRYWDRITRPEQLMQSLPHAMSILTDQEMCGPVTLALPQDVQAQAYDFPESFFSPVTHRQIRQGADLAQLEAAAQTIAEAKHPLIIAGGGVHYSSATSQLQQLALTHGIPVAETQAGKGALAWDHPCNAGSIGVTGSSAANQLAKEADLIIAIGTRLQDFTSGSGMLLGRPDCRILGINIARYDLNKRSSLALRGDARRCLSELGPLLESCSVSESWQQRVAHLQNEWQVAADAAISPNKAELPSDSEVIGVVNALFMTDSTVVCAAGGLPGELHKLWRCTDSLSYHVEYGYSCMGYEIAGGIGVKMACPDRDVVVMVGDGSYLMLNSEIATSVALDQKLIIVVLDNRGFACINRLQTSLGGKGYNNLWDSSYQNEDDIPAIDFAQHAASLGAYASKVDNLVELGAALEKARGHKRTSVVVIDTDPVSSTEAGGAWWDVPVAEVSESPSVNQAAAGYRKQQDER
jgi:3D-(3,5/4)-trihydroxycyclohexane-1,2-dione acylhydrolase (decyclizing)